MFTARPYSAVGLGGARRLLRLRRLLMPLLLLRLMLLLLLLLLAMVMDVPLLPQMQVRPGAPHKELKWRVSEILQLEFPLQALATAC